MNRGIIILIIAVIVAIVIKASAFTVKEGEQVIVTQFGDPKRALTESGLHFRTPFIQEVHRLEKRLLPWDGDAENMPTKDKKRVFIDVWARWRIVDPMQFYMAVGTAPKGQAVLDDLVDSAVRDVVASYNLIDAVRSSNTPLVYESAEFQADQKGRQERISVGRQKMEQEILAVVHDLRDTYGMEVAEVRIKRVNYIESVRNEVYERMKSERMRIASLFESEAEEQRNRIIGNTRKELDEIEGDMEKRSAEIRGEADAVVIKIYADAIGQDLEFYAFLRRLEAYKRTLRPGTRLVLSTDNEFLKLLRGYEPTGN
ncbi:MAG: protease modulator HflC [Phycisphaerae bacterium]